MNFLKIKLDGNDIHILLVRKWKWKWEKKIDDNHDKEDGECKWKKKQNRRKPITVQNTK